MVVTQGHFDLNQNLALSDIKYKFFQGMSFISVNIKRTKTKSHGYSAVIGCSGHVVCAVCTLKQYIQIRSILPFSSPALLVFNNGLPINKTWFLSRTHHLISLIGLQASSYSLHSYRAGAATCASFQGFAEWEIQSLGSWASNAYRMYIREPEAHFIQFARTLVHNLQNISSHIKYHLGFLLTIRLGLIVPNDL